MVFITMFLCNPK